MESGTIQPKSLSRSIFIESLVGNIKEKYFFEKKLGSGGYGAVYLAKNKKTGKSLVQIVPLTATSERFRNTVILIFYSFCR